MKGRIGRITADKAQINLSVAQHLDVGIGAVGGAYINMDMVGGGFNGLGDGLAGWVHASSAVGCPDSENSDRAGRRFRTAGEGSGTASQRAGTEKQSRGKDTYGSASRYKPGMSRMVQWGPPVFMAEQL